ncbi:molecular chaperone HtpG [Planktothrix sp. FACHB-1355]|uniref:molecular chaperone HtpG n=1 Tax=Planktothrix sp. FACHB-1355 TaxID=2692854 RepID=UPI00168A99FC|nr:molecular chaperone HtpG [Planktothrix sp. FACHB-1355]MBD3557349.1 molecular chaperone HtpG [Planktothrix sp. FACHB-1355]
MSATAKSFEFQAETAQLLNIMINSLYTNKDIFLRELISNASDAIDRLRFESLTNKEISFDPEKLEILIQTDMENHILVISDNGIGMSRDELIKNIGTIARSGTSTLREKIAQLRNQEQIYRLIGQFGVGFYSAFMVAEKVELITRRADRKKAFRWISEGKGSFTIEETTKESCGTTIRLYLKPAQADEGIEDYTNRWTLSGIVKKYSDFVSYPIVLEHQPDKPETNAPEKNEVYEKSPERTVLNSMKPLWFRNPKEVSADEYEAFYKHHFHDISSPVSSLHFKAEGVFEYQALLFIPGEAPPDLFYQASKSDLKLYSKGVLIMENCNDLLPRYLRFIKGVIDSTDFPLNISRQMLQQDRHLTQIKKWATKKVLDELLRLKNEEFSKYEIFWNQFGRAFKESVGSDWENREKILSLLLFKSSKAEENFTTLHEYVSRMKEDQDEIYYLTGESIKIVKNSPHLEIFEEKGYEILYLTDPVDELLVHNLHEFENKRIKSVGKGEIKLKEAGEAGEKNDEIKAKEENSAEFFQFLETRLSEYVKQVRFSNRLTKSPACLVVGSEIGESPFMEKILLRGKGGGSKQKRILELNPGNEFIDRFRQRFEANRQDPLLGDFAELLLGYAFLAEGSEIPDTVSFNTAMNSVLSAAV